jgi:hypothetical protein
MGVEEHQYFWEIISRKMYLEYDYQRQLMENNFDSKVHLCGYYLGFDKVKKKKSCKISQINGRHWFWISL